MDDDIHDYDDPDDMPNDDWDFTPNGLINALQSLYVLDGDVFLRMQAFNIGLVDVFISKLETDTLKKLHEEERTPLPEAAFQSAQTQMWIFAVYELLRTWQERCKDIIKLHENGGLGHKIGALEKNQGFQHVGKEMRAKMLRKVQQDPKLINHIKDDLKLVHIPYAMLEHVRISLAKHEVRNRKNSVAFGPGYARIDQYTGSLQYQIEDGIFILGGGAITRRSIADSLRNISKREIPSQEELDSFDQAMRGPPSDVISRLFKDPSTPF